MAASYALPAGRPRPVATSAQAGFWACYDVTLAFLVMVCASDLPNRFGFTTMMWMGLYAMALLRIVLVWPAFWQMLRANAVYLAYPAVCLASTIWSLTPSRSAASGLQIAMTMLIAMFIGWRFNPRQVMLIVYAALMAGVLLSALNLATGGALGRPLYSYVGGLLGVYTNKNMLGHYGLVATLIGLALAFMPRGALPEIVRRLALPGALLGAAMVAMSLSMTSVLLLPVFGLMLLALLRRALPRPLVWASAALALLVVGIGPVALAMLNIDPVDEVLRATGKDLTLTGRTELWGIGLRAIAQSPLLGYGNGAFWLSPAFEAERFASLGAGSTAPSLHNMAIDIMVGTGALGLGAMLLLLGTTLARAIRFHRSAPSVESSLALVTVMLPITVAMVEPFLYRQHEFPLIWIVVIGVSIASHSPRQPAMPGAGR
ncbi:MAG: O-antigen ligase family protein [Paracoccus sp. (in: a-proteobacteria)]|nr:O-antigen ligase family protein [Paracoccus sp. (in: a-proteobacteria)]